MKQARNLRMILILCTIILAILLIGSTKVDASNGTAENYGVIKSGTISASDIPDTFNLDIKEVEFEKSWDIILDQLIAKLEEKNIEVVKVPSDTDLAGKKYISVGSFELKKTSISIGNDLSKEVNVVYSNSNQYNADTKTSVEQKANNLNIPKIDDTTYKCVKEIELGDKNAWGGWWEQYAIDILTKAFNDSSITVLEGITGFGDGPDPFDDGWIKPFYIFKNGVYYTTIEAFCGYSSKITVPSNVEDIENYAISKIEEYLKAYTEQWGDYCNFSAVEKVRISKVTGNTYKVYLTEKNKEYEVTEISIIKSTSDNTGSTDTKPITKEDKTTGIKIEAQVGSISVNITIYSNKVTDQALLNKVAEVLKNISSKYIVYDISLLENNTKVQPNGKIKVSIPIPSGYDTTKLVVYRVTDNGEKIEYKPTVNGSYATIETDHFSTYVLAETGTGTVKTPSQDKPNTSTSNSNKLDETPKTGINNTVLIASAIVSIVSLAGIIIIKKK